MANQHAWFDRYYHGRNTTVEEGAGLGLSVSKGLIEAHGGTIEAKSSPGKGTDIRISLPVSKNKTDR